MVERVHDSVVGQQEPDNIADTVDTVGDCNIPDEAVDEDAGECVDKVADDEIVDTDDTDGARFVVDISSSLSIRLRYRDLKQHKVEHCYIAGKFSVAVAN